MIQKILETIPGVSTLPMISLFLFLIFFIGVFIWAFFRVDNEYLKRMEELPLDSSNSTKINGE